MNSWILSFSSTGTSFRLHMHGEKLFRGIGSFSSAGSRPWDMEGGGRSYRPCDKRRGGGGVSKLFFRPFGPYFGLKIRGGGAGPPRAPSLDPPMFSQPSQRKRVLNEKQADPFARAKSWQQRTRMLWLSRPARFDATGRDKVFMSLWKKVLSSEGDPTIDKGQWPG